MRARQPSCALATLQKLAWAYLERQAAGDWTRASQVLSRVATTFRDNREGFASEIGVEIANLPAASALDSSGAWTDGARIVVGLALDSSFVGADGETVNAEARRLIQDSIPASAAAIPTFYERLSGMVASDSALRQYVNFVQAAPAAQLGATLDSVTNAHLQCAPASANAQNSSSSGGSGTPSTAVVELPPVEITGQAAPRVPTWVWWVGGAGFSAALLYFGYQAWMAEDGPPIVRTQRRSRKR